MSFVPNLLLDLTVDRVDLVDEGANSEAFIKLYKRKENEQVMELQEILAKMKPEHAQVVQDAIAKAKAEVPETTAEELAKAKGDLATANEALAKAKADAEAAEAKVKELECAKKSEATDNMDEVIKSLDPAVQEVFKSIKAQKEAAEEVVRKMNEQMIEQEAIAKAKELKALPVEEAKLVAVMKGASAEVFDILKAANAAIENSGLLDEVGKSKKGSDGTDAWSKIEKKADEIAKRDAVTKQKAIATAIKENPELYREYLSGGAN